MVITKDCGAVTVEGSVNVFADLTLEAGAQLVAADRAEISVGYGNKSARLLVKGTAEAPVTITGASKAAGAWAGVHLYDGAARSSIDNLTIEHAGADEAAALTVAAADVTLGAITVRTSKGPAVNLEIASVTALASLSVEQVGAPALRSTAEAASGVLAISGAGAEAHIVSGRFSRESKLAAIGVPWVITYEAEIASHESTPAVLTVAAGAELRFTESGWLSVGYGHTGKLVLAGEAGKEITLSSARDAQPGAWRGVAVYSEGTLEAKHVKISAAGRDDGAAIDVNDQGRATLTNVAFATSNRGVRARSNQATLAVSNCSFTAVPVALELAPHPFGGVAAGNSYDSQARIHVLDGYVERDTNWTSQAAIVELRGDISVEGSKLTVAAGKYQVADGATISVGYSRGATLELQGSAEQPVELVGLRDEPELWGPITIYGNAGTRAIMQHVVLGSVAGSAGVVVENNANVKIDNLRCDRCAASLQWACAAKLEQTNVAAGTDTATALIAPEDC